MNWDEITRSPQYQQAENDYEREVIRNNFIQQTVDHYGWDENQAAQFRSEFDKYTAPRGNVYSGELNDAWNSIRSGAASATADMAQFFTGGTPNAVSQGIRGYADDWAEDRSPSTIQAVENFGFGEGQELTGRGFTYGALSGLGSMAPMVAGGGLLGKGLQYGGKALTGYGKAKKALEAADNVTDATQAAGRLAKLDKNIDRASSTLGYGSVGGAMVGGGAGNQTYQEVMALDDQTLLKSKEFQNYYRQTYQETPDNKRQAFDKAKAMLAEDLAAGATVKAGAIGAGSMALLGPQLQKIVTGKGPQGIFKGGAAGAGTEGIQETFEGGGQQWATNTELAGIDGRSQWQNVGNVAATGALLGMGSGGPIGALGGAFNRGQQEPTQEQLATRITENQRQMTATEQALREHDENVRFLEMQLQDPTADQTMLGQQLKERQALRDKTATELQGLAFSNAQMQQMIKQAVSQAQTQPEQNEETQQANWQGWSNDGVDYNRPAGSRSNTQGEQFRAPRTNPFNDMGEQRIGRDDGKPFKTMVELQDYAERMKLTRFPFMVQKVNGGYVLVGMPDQQQQQAEQQGAIARVNSEQATDFERVLEGQYIPLSDIIQARQAQQAAQPTLTQQPQQQTAPQAERELFPYQGAAREFMQRNGIQGEPVQLYNGLWTIRPQQGALTDERRMYVDRDGRASDSRQNLAEDRRARQHPGYPRESAIQSEPAPQPQPAQPLALEDQRRTYVDSRGNTADNLQAINQQARTDRESAAAQNHPGYAYTGDDSDYQKYSEKASQLNKLMRKFQGDPRDKGLFKELKQLIQETKRLEKSAMEQAKARRRRIATVNRVTLLQQARAALEGKRLDEFNNLMADIRQTNYEEQQRLSGQDSANNTAYDSRLSNQQYRDYLQMTAEEVQAQEQLDRARAQAAKGKGGKVKPDDTLLTAIGRLGGLRTDTVEDTVGESIKYWAKSEAKGLSGRFLNKNGLTLDDMGRILSEYGYYDQNGQEYGANSLTVAITEEIAGRPRFSQAMGDYSQVAQQQSLRSASGASNVTAPAVRAALAGEPLSPAYRQEVSRILDEAESDPYFDRPEFLSQQAADIEQSRQDNAVTYDWYDRMEPVVIGYADAKTDLDASTFDGEDWGLIEAEARDLSTLADAQANEQFNQVEEDGDTDQRTSPTVRYGSPRMGEENRQESVQGRQSEAEGTEQRGSNPQEVSEQPPQFDLTTQTKQELQQQAEQQKAAEAEARKQEEQARQKAAADKEADDFVLSGSSSASDQAAARGQADLLGDQPESSQSDTLPPKDAPRAQEIADLAEANGYEWRENNQELWAWFKDGKQITGAYDNEADKLYATEVNNLEYRIERELKASEAASIKDHPEYDRLDKVYGNLSDKQIREKLQQMDADIQQNSKAAHREFNNNGGRRTSAAVSAQAVRDIGQEKLLLNAYLEERASNNDQITEPNPEPTEAQKQAGNYKKEHIKLQGLDISLENKRGSTRSGTDPDGNEWSVTMAHDYGYIKRTEGADGDQVDVFIGENPDSDQVFIVDQVNKDGSFDEHKVMLGFADRESAIDGYKANYQKGWKVGEVTQLTMSDFKNWLKEGDTTKPASKQKIGDNESNKVTVNTRINFTAIVRDENGEPFFVLTKRHGKIELAPFKNGKPFVNADSAFWADLKDANYTHDNEWFDSDTESIVTGSLQERQNTESKPASQQQIEATELSGKVDDDTLNTEYHYKAAQNAFQHSSRNAPQSYREGFIRTVKEVYQAGLEKAETDQQKAALDTAIQQFKADYLEAEKAYFAVRSGVASSHIAGRNKFNSRQAEKRGNADDRALEKLNNRINALKPDVARAVSDARTPEQKQRDTEATEQKRNQQTENKLIEELAGYAGLIAAPGMDKNTFRGKALEFLNKLHNHSPEAAQKTMATIEQTLEKVGGYKKVFGGRSNLYKRWQELKGEPAQQSESKTGKPEANKKPRNLKTDSASKVYSNINMGGYSILSDGARVTITGSNGEAIAQIETEDGTIYQQQAESIQGSSVNNAIKKLLSDYFKGKAKPVEDNTEPTPPKGSKPKTESQSEQKPEGQPAKQEAGQKTPDWSKATINEAFDGISSMMDGEMSFPEYQALAQGITGNIDGLRAEFASMTKNKILGRMGRYFAAFHRDDKKDALVESALETVLNSLKVGKRTSDSLISFEQVIRGEDRIQKRIDAINKVTEDDYKAYLEDRKKQEAEAKQKNEERQKALDNPETLEEYQYFIERKGEDALNPDQMEQLDALITEKRLNKEQEADEKKAEVSGVSGDTAYTTAETTHAKKGIPLFVVSLDGRVEREQFNELRNKAKALGGWYSGFNKNGAIPGFQFESDDTRQQFINVLAGETESSNKVEQKKQTAQEKRVEKLRQMAGEFEQGGEQALNADRKTNTAKRSREAASAWRAAENSIKHGRLLRQIAEASEAGLVKLLSRINANTQLEELLSIRNRLKWNAVWKNSDLVEREPGSADNYQWKEGVTVNQIVADANFDLRVWTSKVKDLLEAMSETKGYKQAAKGMLKAIENYQEDYIDLNHPALWRHIDKLKTFARENRGTSSRLQWEAEAVYEPFLKQHRLAQMGITDGASLRFALRELYEVEKGVEAVKRDRLKDMELELSLKKFPGFFPTPDATIDTLLDHANIQPGMSMLEPSAGKGDIADRMRQDNPDAEITVIEIQKTLRNFLEARGFQPEGMDFLEHEGQYDRIVMNPPFEDGQDMVHVQHAYNQLTPGGRLVAVMSAASGDRQRKQDQAFKEWVEENGGVFEPLPEGSFKSSFRPTGVNTKVLIMDKSEGDSATSDNRYRLNRDNAQGINQTTADRVAATMGDQLGVKVNVAMDESQLPQHVQNQMETDGVSGIKGIFDKRTGQAWIVAENLADERQAIKTVLHEVAGHQALTNMLGSTMNSIMARIHNDMLADVKARIEKEYASQLKGMDEQTRKAVIAEEYLAHLAETNPTSSTFKRFVSKVRRVLRKLFKNMEWTQDDVVELLEAARKKLKENPAGISGASNTSYEAIDVAIQPAARSTKSIDQRKTEKLSEDNPSDSNTDNNSSNRYSLAATSVLDSMPDDITADMKRTNAGVRQQEGIVERVKRWFNEMELGTKAAWKAMGDKFYTGVIDQFDPIARMEKAANSGNLKEGSESAYKAALRTKNLDGIMTAVLGKGTPTLENGSIVVRQGSKGLLEIFEPLAKAGQLEVWEHWAAAKRAQRLLNEGRENLFDQAMIDRINRHVDARPELKRQFEDAHRQYQEFNKQILDFAEQSGLIDPDSRQLWESDDYLPFHRVNRLDDSNQTGLFRRKGLSNQQSGIRTLEGGVEQISPLEAIYRNTASLIDASSKNLAMQRIADIGTATGAMELTRSGIRMTDEQAMDRLKEKGIIGENDTLTGEQLKRWKGLLLKFEELGEGAVKVSRDGQTEVYQVHDQDLLETMQAMGPDTLHGILKFFAVPKRLLTSMVTADPGFMARNFVRDTLSTWMSVHPKIGGQTLHASMMEAMKNVGTGLESDNHWALMMAGGGSGGFYEITPDNIRGKLTPGQYKAHHRRVLDNVEQGWQWWQKQGGRFENANRLAVFSDAIDKGASIAEAAHQAQDVLNFTRRGKWQTTRILTEIIPFLNARIQGLDRLVRGGFQNPSAMLTRGLIYSAASIALWSLFADDERYKELPEHEKLTWHHFWDGEGNHYRIPKPFEMGAIFATIPEVFNNVAFNGEDGEWAGKMIGGMLTDVFAASLPQFIAPAVDVATNENSFTGAPILSLGMQYQLPESQYTPWTSETMKALAEAMPDAAPEWMRSPKRLEYLLRGYFGTLGSYTLMASDVLAREVRGTPERPEMSVRRVPVIGSFFRGNEEGATRYSTEMYDMLRESNSLATTIKNFREQGRLEEAAALELEGRKALDSRTELNRYSRQISKLKKEVRKILGSRFITAPLKKQRIDRLNSQINDLYQEAIQEAGY